MLRTLGFERSLIQRLVGVALFALLTAAAARVRVDVGPVPFTMQTLTVILAGLALGARDGGLSQLTYLSLIALNLPVDTNMIGAAAFVGPTAGFLVSFPLVAFVAGYLAELGGKNLAVRWAAGLVGMVILFASGTLWFAAMTSRTPVEAWTLVGQPFIAVDMAKALVAAGLTETARAWLQRAQG